MPNVVSGQWSPSEFHGVAGSPPSRRWRVAPEGILVEGEAGVRRTKGEPVTARKNWAAYREHVEHAAALYSVPREVVLATLIVESGGNAKAERHEEKIGDWSFGLMQTLTKTASAVIEGDTLRVWGATPKLGDFDGWRAYLFDAERSIHVGARYLSRCDSGQGLKGDPILLYAAYNSGKARYDNSPWGLLYFGDAMDHFAAWYGDCCAVLSS